MDVEIQDPVKMSDCRWTCQAIAYVPSKAEFETDNESLEAATEPRPRRAHCFTEESWVEMANPATDPTPILKMAGDALAFNLREKLTAVMAMPSPN